jgi:alkylation response protein AidB-like acyl-CoA dehydrogenase
MDFGLDDEQQMIVQTVRRFVDKDVRAWAGDADREASPPPRLATVAGDLGFYTDGFDSPYAHLTRALRGIELGRGCAGIAALLETNVEPALAVETWGDAATRAALRGSLDQGGLAAFARDARGRLTIDGGTVSGTIGPVPALGVATHLLVIVGDAVGLIATEAATRTAITPNVWRAAQWGSLTCDRTPIAILPTAPADLILAWHRTSLAARAVGVAMAAMEHADKYGRDRVQFGQPIGTFESLVRLRDDAETGAAAARLMVLHAAWLLDRGDPAAIDVASRARVIAGDVVARATIDAVQIFGGYGFVNDFPVEKLMRDARPFEALNGDERLDRVLEKKRS